MEHYWYKNIVIYAIDVKSFYDANGDGIGDLKGLTEKLPYLSDLGVTCLWLLPFFPSPLRDNGYDVSDYYQVDPRIGTLSDFQHLVIKASERGISVVIDIVMNHTSNEHPWFVAARNDAKSIFRDYYVWSDVPPPRDPLDHPAFPNSEDGLWHFDSSARSFFYHKFYHFQPDLKISNTKVQEEIHKVLDYWFSFGIAGVRLDAVPTMIHKKGLESTRPLNSKDIFCQLRRTVSSKRKEAILLGEVDVDGNELVDYFADGDGLQLIFNFLLNAYIVGAIAEEKAETIMRGWRELPVIPESGSWLNFLRNLDELNINQLPPRIRSIVLNQFAPEEKMKLYNRGLRRRLASMLGGNQKRIEMSYSLLFSLPGTPMLVYGDEIGMGENLDLWEREAVRTPMQWAPSEGGGFSKNSSINFYRAMVESEKFHFSKINVESQLHEEGSLLSKIKKLIKARSLHPEIGFGRIGWVSVNHPSVLSHVCHWKNEMLLAIHNLSGNRVDVQLDLKTVFAKDLVPIIGAMNPTRIEDGQYEVHIGPYDYGWFQVNFSKEL
jgi:maltose alpha-D-glucosyltransferase/alpha-amylase